MNQYAGLIPDLLLSVGATIVLIAGALGDDRPLREFLRWLSLIVVVAAGVAVYAVYRGPIPDLAMGWLSITPLNVMFCIVFLAIVGWVIVAGNVPEHGGGEWYSLLLFAALGMLVLARSANLAALFLGLEVLSISLYVLIAFSYGRGVSLKAGIMYLILAGFASGFLLFGIALLYASYGTLDIAALSRLAGGVPGMPMIAVLGFGLFLAGVAFKLAVVPFHMWTPDVYEAAPGAVTGLIASASKGAILAAFIPFMFVLPTHWKIIWALSAASMIGGNLLALREMRVKRILAYSSIAHVGYILVGYLGGPGSQGNGLIPFVPVVSGPNSILFYVVAYALSILGAFICISLMEREDLLTLNTLHGLARRKPVIAGCLLVFVISLAGLPPTIGFFGKIYLFSAGVSAGYVWLAIIGLIGSAIGVFYYVRILIHLFMWPTGSAYLKVADTPLQTGVLVATAIATVLFGLFPDAVFSLLRAPF